MASYVYKSDASKVGFDSGSSLMGGGSTAIKTSGRNCKVKRETTLSRVDGATRKSKEPSKSTLS